MEFERARCLGGEKTKRAAKRGERLRWACCSEKKQRREMERLTQGWVRGALLRRHRQAIREASVSLGTTKEEIIRRMSHHVKPERSSVRFDDSAQDRWLSKTLVCFESVTSRERVVGSLDLEHVDGLVQTLFRDRLHQNAHLFVIWTEKGRRGK